ncbi:hypothetical protein VPH35_014456 [Triticum aestivum]
MVTVKMIAWLCILLQELFSDKEVAELSHGWHCPVSIFSVVKLPLFLVFSLKTPNSPERILFIIIFFVCAKHYSLQSKISVVVLVQICTKTTTLMLDRREYLIHVSCFLLFVI